MLQNLAKRINNFSDKTLTMKNNRKDNSLMAKILEHFTFKNQIRI